MEEKTILFAVLGVVAVVAVIGMISFMKSADTGMGIYIEPGQFSRGLAIRQIGSGEQSSVSNIGQGVFRTAGESQIPTGSSRQEQRVPGAYEQCIPRADDGNFMYDAKGNIVIGWEIAAYSASKSSILRCTANYFKDVGTPLPDQLCCWNTYESKLEGSTGAAYRS